MIAGSEQNFGIVKLQMMNDADGYQHKGIGILFVIRTSKSVIQKYLRVHEA